MEKPNLKTKSEVNSWTEIKLYIPFSVSHSKALSLQYKSWGSGVLGNTHCLVGDDQLDHRQCVKHSDGDDVPK